MPKRCPQRSDVHASTTPSGFASPTGSWQMGQASGGSTPSVGLAAADRDGNVDESIVKSDFLGAVGMTVVVVVTPGSASTPCVHARLPSEAVEPASASPGSAAATAGVCSWLRCCRDLDSTFFIKSNGFCRTLTLPRPLILAELDGLEVDAAAPRLGGEAAERQRRPEPAVEGEGDARGFGVGPPR